MRDMRPRELESHLAASAEPPLLLDVREPWEFEICHIAGSTLVPMQR
ncbi:MAG: rhodanese-like domain-containing protein, partial [Gammaproteobacteria bacterium]|nr:rhodanese-like domain-containing protein [Gammaproteobacteria bacterium]